MKQLLNDGQLTGFRDERGRDIRIGDVIRRYVPSGDIEAGHGSWIEYAVKCAGVVPMLTGAKCQSGSSVDAVLLLSDCYLRSDMLSCLDSPRPNIDMVGMAVVGSGGMRID